MTKRKSESTEKDQMKRLIICKLCHETLEDPIILPCGKTICSKHLLNEANIFKCGLCGNSHDKTVDKFPFNEELNELLQICDTYVNLNSIDLGPEYKKAKEKFKNLNDIIKESELLIRDPAFYINDYFSKLKNEIDLSKEQLIKDILQKHEQLINELNEIETKCKQNAEKKESNKKLDQTIKANKQRLNEWNQTLESNLNLGSCCENITAKSRVSINELKYEMNKCQQDLLDNKQYKFNSIPTKDSAFGNLEVSNMEIIDESRLEGTLRFEIKDFLQFKNTLKECRFIDQWLVVNNISWTISAQIKEIDYDIYLSVLTSPLELTNEYLKSKPIKVQLSFKMLKTNAEPFGQQTGIIILKNTNAIGFDKFILLKDLMNPSNNLFNKKKDSVTFEARIKIIQ